MEEVKQLIEEEDVRQLVDQLLAEGTNNGDSSALEEGLMLSKMLQLVEDDTAKHALDAATNGDYSTMEKHLARFMDFENALTAYEQNRDPWRRVWNPIELVLILGQIVIAIVILVHLKGEEDLQTPLFCWIIVYTCGCIANLPLIFYRMCCVTISMDHLMYYKLQKLLEELFVFWCMLLFGYFFASSSSLNDTTQHIWFSLAFFAFITIRYVIPNRAWIKAWLPLVVIELIGNFVAELNLTQLLLLGLVYVIIGSIVRCLCAEDEPTIEDDFRAAFATE